MAGAARIAGSISGRRRLTRWLLLATQTASSRILPNRDPFVNQIKLLFYAVADLGDVVCRFVVAHLRDFFLKVDVVAVNLLVVVHEVHGVDEAVFAFLHELLSHSPHRQLLLDLLSDLDVSLLLVLVFFFGFRFL